MAVLLLFDFLQFRMYSEFCVKIERKKGRKIGQKQGKTKTKHSPETVYVCLPSMVTTKPPPQ